MMIMMIMLLLRLRNLFEDKDAPSHPFINATLPFTIHAATSDPLVGLLNSSILCDNPLSHDIVLLLKVLLLLLLQLLLLLRTGVHVPSSLVLFNIRHWWAMA